MRSLVGLALCLLLAASSADADVGSVRECVEANTPRISAVQELALDVKQEDGESSFASRFTLFWQRLRDGERRTLLRFTDPEDLAETALLVNARRSDRPKVYIYLPDQGKPRRVKSRGELEGFLGRANLGVTELELLLDPVGGKDIELIDESANLDGRTVWVLEEREGDDTRYSRTVTFIDREFCIPLRAELYDQDQETRKILDVELSSITRVVDSWVPKLLVFRDLRENVDTHIRVEEVDVDVRFSPALLTVEVLPEPVR